MLIVKRKGQVSVESGGMWILHDPDSGFISTQDSGTFAGAMNNQGAFFISEQFAPLLDVTIEVHSESPSPSGLWPGSVVFTASFPAKSAWAYGPPLERFVGRDYVENIELPSQEVLVRAAVRQLDAEAKAQEEWLVQVWPSDAG